MDDLQTPVENPPPKPDKHKFLFLLVALAPVPIGLLFGPMRLAGDVLNGKPGLTLIGFNVLTIICCVAGCIGIFEGYQKGAWEKRFAGIGVGIMFWVAEITAVGFIGCCQGLTHI